MFSRRTGASPTKWQKSCCFYGCWYFIRRRQQSTHSVVLVWGCIYTYKSSFGSRHTPEMIENTFPIILGLTGRRWSPALLFCAELTMKQRGGKKKKKLTIFPYGCMSWAISWIMAFPQTSELQLWQRKYSAAKTVTFNYMNIKCRVHSGVVLGC